jgi:hypothetical protein
MSVKDRKLLVRLPSAGMEICRWYILASIFFLIPGQDRLPLLPSALSLISAMLLSMMMTKFKRRRLTALIIHSIGFFTSLCFILKSYTGLSFSSAEGLPYFLEAYSRINSPGEWFAFTLILGWSLFLWLRGRNIGIHHANYRRTIGRFDAGLLLIFSIYFLRMGLQLEDPDSIAFVTGYLVFGMLAVYAARNDRNDPAFIHSSSFAGHFILFIGGFLLLGAAGIVLYPIMDNAAESIYSALQEGTKPLRPYLVALLRFLFSPRAARSQSVLSGEPASGEISAGPPQEPGFWAQLFEEILMIGFLGILILLFAVMAIYLLSRFIHFVLPEQDSNQEQYSFIEFLRTLLLHAIWQFRKFLTVFRKIPEAFLSKGNPGHGISGLRRLYRWGQTSGISRRTTETLAEYGQRLIHSFPDTGDAIHKIIHAAETEIYSKRQLNTRDIQHIRISLRMLKKISLYPSRLAVRLGIRK